MNPASNHTSPATTPTSLNGNTPPNSSLSEAQKTHRSEKEIGTRALTALGMAIKEADVDKHSVPGTIIEKALVFTATDPNTGESSTLTLNLIHLGTLAPRIKKGTLKEHKVEVDSIIQHILVDKGTTPMEKLAVSFVKSFSERKPPSHLGNSLLELFVVDEIAKSKSNDE